MLQHIARLWKTTSLRLESQLKSENCDWCILTAFLKNIILLKRKTLVMF